MKIYAVTQPAEKISIEGRGDLSPSIYFPTSLSGAK